LNSSRGHSLLFYNISWTTVKIGYSVAKAGSAQFQSLVTFVARAQRLKYCWSLATLWHTHFFLLLLRFIENCMINPPLPASIQHVYILIWFVQWYRWVVGISICPPAKFWDFHINDRGSKKKERFTINWMEIVSNAQTGIKRLESDKNYITSVASRHNTHII